MSSMLRRSFSFDFEVREAKAPHLAHVIAFGQKAVRVDAPAICVLLLIGPSAHFPRHSMNECAFAPPFLANKE